MHKKHASKGLAVISVSVDELSMKGSKDAAERFLIAQNAGFTNLLLDEPIEFRQAKLGFAAIPCQFVFDRNGRWTRFADGDDIDPKKVERLIEEYLADK